MNIATLMLAVAFPLTATAQVSGVQETVAPNKPMHTYRLTYTLTELDAGKKLGLQHYTLTVNPDTHHATLKLRSKVPFCIGGCSTSGSTQSSFTYYDIGLSIDAALTTYANGIQVETVLDKTDVADSQPEQKILQPVIREADLTNTAMLSPGKPVQLGSIDIPGSTRHFDVEVTMESVF